MTKEVFMALNAKACLEALWDVGAHPGAFGALSRKGLWEVYGLRIK